MPITREEAWKIAEEYMAGDPKRERRPVVKVVTYQEVLAAGTRPPMPYDVMGRDALTSWIVYLEGLPAMLGSSTIALVSRDTGQVLYYGSANDEG
jgi:hypothetical protein